MDLDAVRAPESVLEPAELKRSLSSLDRQGYWRAAPARTLALFAAFTLGYAVLAGVGYATARTLGDFVVFWPAAGLLGGVMVATPPRTWPLWLTGAIAGRFLTNAVLLESYPSQVSLAFGIASALEALVFAVLLTRPLDESYRLRRPLYFMTALCVAAVVSSALGALIGAGISVKGDVAAPFAELWRRQLLGDYLGLIIGAPLTAWLVLPPLGVRRRRRAAREPGVHDRVADYQSKLRSMAREIALGEERARRRAAVDLHDGIGQNLAVVRMTIGRLLAGGELDERALREARDLVDSALRSMRHVIAELSPAILYELGLGPAIRSLAERFEPANDIRCNVEETGDAWTLPNDLEVELYRMVRELLTNVGKHAEAGTVTIRIDWTEDDVGIAVEDDGVGFDAGAGRPVGVDYQGFGIFSVREGVHLMGGTLAIDATPGVGTRVRLRVPRPQREAGR